MIASQPERLYFRMATVADCGELEALIRLRGDAQMRVTEPQRGGLPALPVDRLQALLAQQHSAVAVQAAEIVGFLGATAFEAHCIKKLRLGPFCVSPNARGYGPALIRWWGRHYARQSIYESVIGYTLHDRVAALYTRRFGASVVLIREENGRAVSYLERLITPKDRERF